MIKSPKEREVEKKKQLADFEKKFKQIRSDFITVASTPEGLNIFRFFMETCGYQKNNIVFNPDTKEINKGASDYLEARRSVYLEMRKYIPAKYLKRIEFK